MHFREPQVLYIHYKDTPKLRTPPHLCVRTPEMTITFWCVSSAQICSTHALYTHSLLMRRLLHNYIHLSYSRILLGYLSS